MKTEAGPAVACMFITGSENLDTPCMGCIGSKGEKFCAKPKVGFGELNTFKVGHHSGLHSVLC
jgi:hypothetical protein